MESINSRRISRRIKPLPNPGSVLDLIENLFRTTESVVENPPDSPKTPVPPKGVESKDDPNINWRFKVLEIDD
jgi:hypothetical protein